jgi:flagellar biosynthesis chaperone FliJ
VEQEKSYAELLQENKKLTEELEKTRDQLGNVRILNQKNYDLCLEWKKKYDEIASIKDLFRLAEEKIESLLKKGINIRDVEIDNLNRKIQKLDELCQTSNLKVLDLEQKIEIKNQKLSQMGNENKVLRKINETLKIELGKILPNVKNEE